MFEPDGSSRNVEPFDRSPAPAAALEEVKVDIVGGEGAPSAKASGGGCCVLQ